MVEVPNMVRLNSVPLSDEALSCIGLIVRACADLEDALNLWICKLSSADEAVSAVMLGRTNVSTKVALALGLAKLKGDETVTRHKEAFDVNLTNLLECRNAVAHGVYQGQTDAGHWTFMTASTLDYQGGALIKKSVAYSTKTLQVTAFSGAARVALLDDLLELKSLRDKRQWQEVEEHLERQPKGKKAK